MELTSSMELATGSVGLVASRVGLAASRVELATGSMELATRRIVLTNHCIGLVVSSFGLVTSGAQESERTGIDPPRPASGRIGECGRQTNPSPPRADGRGEPDCAPRRGRQRDRGDGACRCGDPAENAIPLDCRTGTDDPEEAVDLSCAYSCATEQHFTYAWDEVNRIAHARRLDREDGGAWELAVEQRYLYDASNQRTVKTTTFHGIESGTERSALYVYPGDFERRGLVRSSEFSTFGPGRYEAVAGDTETQYGVGGARIVWRTSDRDETLDRDQRITLTLTDLIQSTTAVIDLATGELVEAGSFYANGARETYRSNETETVTPEPMGFTGKEADEEVGLTYFGHRSLMAHLGRWASPDPLHQALNETIGTGTDRNLAFVTIGWSTFERENVVAVHEVAGHVALAEAHRDALHGLPGVTFDIDTQVEDPADLNQWIGDVALVLPGEHRRGGGPLGAPRGVDPDRRPLSQGAP